MKHVKYFWPILLIFLIACNRKIGFPDFDCIGNFTDYAYFPANWDLEMNDVTLPDQWEEVLELPNETIPYTTATTVLAPIRNGVLEIWIHRYYITPNLIENPSGYFIYEPETNELFSVSAKIEDNWIWVDKLFISSDGSIWGQNILSNSPSVDYETNYLPTISKFNEQINEFELDYNSPLRSIQIENFDAIYQTEILLDNNDIFWVFIPYEGLFRYDPEKKEVKQVLDLPEGIVGDAVLGLDESIFFIMNNYSVGLQQGELLQFFPESQELHLVNVPEDTWPFYRNLAIDSEGKLWIGAIGWRDSNGEWGLLYPDTADYFANIGDSIAWVPPALNLVSSDGYFWFEFANTWNHKGMAWFNPSTEEGCWFTTEVGNIIEDENKILWLSVAGKLFKYELNP